MLTSRGTWRRASLLNKFIMQALDFSNDAILKDLNQDQLCAVTHGTGPLLIFAGAGSGKTRTITRRIAYLVRERAVLPGHILAVTFTNKAAQEMRERVEKLLGGRDAPRWIGTFHSICLRLLRMHADRIGYPTGFVVYDEDDSETLLKHVLKDLGFPKGDLRSYASYIAHIKDSGTLEPPEPVTPRQMDYKNVFEAYQTALRKACAMDFGDLLALTLKLLQDNEDIRAVLQDRFEYVFVDEFQDTNGAQYEIVKLLAGSRRNLCVVGDDDQSIYSWRGARLENIFDFQKDFPDATIITLRTNYRSRRPILTAASHLIGFNRMRHPKELKAIRGDGEPVYLHACQNEQDEATFVVNEIVRAHRDGVRFSDMAVFFRTNAQSRSFEDALRSRRIPYRVIGGVRFYQRREIKDVLAYLRLLVNPMDDVALERVLNVPPRGLGPATLKKAREEAHGISLIEALAKVGDSSGPALSKKIEEFVEMITTLAIMAREMDAASIVRETLERTGYLKWLQEDDSPEGRSRIENVGELLTSVHEFCVMSGRSDLASYLDQVALVQPVDELEESQGDRVNLMTVHTAKGLEFDIVFVCGLEEGLFPLNGPYRGHDNFGELSKYRKEEERRLMYVAMTRAKERLVLTYARNRTRFGETRFAIPSVFVSEIPRSVLRVV